MGTQDMRIFISHSHEDNDFCKQLVDTLAGFPVDVWYDQTNLTRGAVITDEIAREIKQRPISLFILSPAAMRSGWVKLEARGIVEQSVHDPTRMILPITAQPLNHDDFIESWLFLQGLKRIEADQTYQPLSTDEAITHLLWALALENRPAGEQSAFEAKAEDLVRQSRPYLARRDYQTTLALVDEAIRGDNSLFDAWFLKGEAHLGMGASELGNYSLARESFLRSVLQAQASDKAKRAVLLPTALCGEGRALMALLRQAEARRCFKNAVALDPHYADAWSGQRCQEAVMSPHRV